MKAPSWWKHWYWHQGALIAAAGLNIAVPLIWPSPFSPISYVIGGITIGIIFSQPRIWSLIESNRQLAAGLESLWRFNAEEVARHISEQIGADVQVLGEGDAPSITKH